MRGGCLDGQICGFGCEEGGEGVCGLVKRVVEKDMWERELGGVV